MPVRTVGWSVLGALAVGAVLLFNYWASFQPLSTLAYLGIVAALLGLASVAVPFRFLGIRRRAVGALVFACGAGLAAAALSWPAKRIRVAQPRTVLDAVVPEYQFGERHAVRVHAQPEVVMAAVRASTWSDLRSLPTLLKIRATVLRTPQEENGAFAPDQRVLDDFAKSGYVMGGGAQEVVLGNVVDVRERRRVEAHTLEDIAAYRKPGALKLAFDFRVEDAGSGWSTLTTETRMAAQKEFSRGPAIYWRLIVPGSGLLRRQWLDGIRRRAEAGR